VEAAQVDGGNKRKKKESTSVRATAKRRRGEPMHSVPMIDGASAQVRDWSYGNLSKRDASRFAKAVRFMFYSSLFLFFIPTCSRNSLYEFKPFYAEFLFVYIILNFGSGRSVWETKGREEVGPLFLPSPFFFGA